MNLPTNEIVFVSRDAQREPRACWFKGVDFDREDGVLLEFMDAHNGLTHRQYAASDVVAIDYDDKDNVIVRVNA